MKASIALITLLFVSDTTCVDIGQLIEQLPKIEVVLRGLITIFSLRSTGVGRVFLIEHWKIIISFVGVVGCGIKKYSDWRIERKKISNEVSMVSGEVKTVRNIVRKLGEETGLICDDLNETSSKMQSKLDKVGSDVESLQSGQVVIEGQLKTVATQEHIAVLSESQQIHQGSITHLKSLTQKIQVQLKSQGEKLNDQLRKIREEQVKQSEKLQAQLTAFEKKMSKKVGAVGKTCDDLFAQFCIFQKQPDQSSEKIDQLGEELISIKELLESQSKQSVDLSQKINELIVIFSPTTGGNLLKDTD